MVFNESSFTKTLSSIGGGIFSGVIYEHCGYISYRRIIVWGILSFRSEKCEYKNWFDEGDEIIVSNY